MTRRDRARPPAPDPAAPPRRHIAPIVDIDYRIVHKDGPVQRICRTH